MHVINLGYRTAEVKYQVPMSHSILYDVITL